MHSRDLFFAHSQVNLSLLSDCYKKVCASYAIKSKLVFFLLFADCIFQNTCSKVIYHLLPYVPGWLKGEEHDIRCDQGRVEGAKKNSSYVQRKRGPSDAEVEKEKKRKKGNNVETQQGAEKSLKKKKRRQEKKSHKEDRGAGDSQQK